MCFLMLHTCYESLKPIHFLCLTSRFKAKVFSPEKLIKSQKIYYDFRISAVKQGIVKIWCEFHPKSSPGGRCQIPTVQFLKKIGFQYHCMLILLYYRSLFYPKMQLLYEKNILFSRVFCF